MAKKSQKIPENNNYKRPDVLRQYVDDNYKVMPRRRTKLNSAQQRRLTKEIKRARKLALLPYTPDHGSNVSS